MTDRGEAVREFYRQQGEQRERERIIALLEERNWHYYHDWNQTPGQVSENVWGIREAIALIKGENNE